MHFFSLIETCDNLKVPVVACGPAGNEITWGTMWNSGCVLEILKAFLAIKICTNIVIFRKINYLPRLLGSNCL